MTKWRGTRDGSCTYARLPVGRPETGAPFIQLREGLGNLICVLEEVDVDGTGKCRVHAIGRPERADRIYCMQQDMQVTGERHAVTRVAKGQLLFHSRHTSRKRAATVS